MAETVKTRTNGYGIYRMLDAIKSKFPSEYMEYIYNGVYIGLKSDYIRYVMEPTRNHRMQFFMIFVKDDPDRSDKYQGWKYTKSNKNRWFYLISGFNKFELLDLNTKIRRELYKYINNYDISVVDYYNKKMLREEKLFYFDDSHELHGNNKYENYIKILKK